MLSRGDIIDIHFEFPRMRGSKTHPAIIISNSDVYDAEEGYVCVIMTSREFTDKFTFQITDDMLQGKNNKTFSQARCQFVTFVHEDHIIDRYAKNTLKPNSVERLITHINNYTFAEDY